MVRAVIFDCFGVLYVDPSLAFYQREVKNYDSLRTAISDIDKQYDYGYITDVDHAQMIASITGLHAGFVRNNVRGDHVRNQPLLEYSQALRQRYKVGMLSNIGHGGMESFFSAKEQTELFDAVVLSSDVGVIKPNREIFQITANRLGVEPSECVMIDDRSDNVDGAFAAGMQGILYQTNQQCQAELEAILEQNNA